MDFKDVCKTFYFNKKNNNELIFFDENEVFSINYKSEGRDRKKIYGMKNTLNDPPNYAVFSPD